MKIVGWSWKVNKLSDFDVLVNLQRKITAFHDLLAYIRNTIFFFFFFLNIYPVPVMVSINWIYRNYKVRWSLFPKFHHVGGISFVVRAFFFIFRFFLLKEHLFLTCSSSDRLVATKH
jgi:hypothetical protein